VARGGGYGLGERLPIGLCGADEVGGRVLAEVAPVAVHELPVGVGAVGKGEGVGGHEVPVHPHRAAWLAGDGPVEIGPFQVPLLRPPRLVPPPADDPPRGAGPRCFPQPVQGFPERPRCPQPNVERVLQAHADEMGVSVEEPGEDGPPAEGDQGRLRPRQAEELGGSSHGGDPPAPDGKGIRSVGPEQWPPIENQIRSHRRAIISHRGAGRDRGASLARDVLYD